MNKKLEFRKKRQLFAFCVSIQSWFILYNKLIFDFILLKPLFKREKKNVTIQTFQFLNEIDDDEERMMLKKRVQQIKKQSEQIINLTSCTCLPGNKIPKWCKRIVKQGWLFLFCLTSNGWMVEGRNGNSSNASPNAHSSEDCLNESNNTGNRKAVGE